MPYEDFVMDSDHIITESWIRFFLISDRGALAWRKVHQFRVRCWVTYYDPSGTQKSTKNGKETREQVLSTVRNAERSKMLVRITRYKKRPKANTDNIKEETHKLLVIRSW